MTLRISLYLPIHQKKELLLKEMGDGFCCCLLFKKEEKHRLQSFQTPAVDGKRAVLVRNTLRTYQHCRRQVCTG